MSRDVKFDMVYGGSSAAAENIAEESPSSNVKNNITVIIMTNPSPVNCAHVIVIDNQLVASPVWYPPQ